MACIETSIELHIKNEICIPSFLSAFLWRAFSLVSIYIGYQQAVINPLIPSLPSFVGTEDDTLITLIVVAIPLGAVIGSCFGLAIISKVGRRGGIMVNNVIGVLGCLVTGCYPSLETALLGRLICGISVGL